jgi:ABC-2 type transport system ATP-binding protein
VTVALLALLLALTGAALLAGAGTAAPGEARIEEQRIEVPGGPGGVDPVDLDATLYLPARTPAPAVLVAHGFGGSKASVDADARALADRGFVVLAWSARGFGASTGQIALNAPDAEVADARALVDWLAERPEVTRDAPGDPRVGVTGASYGGALSLLLAGYDDRVDALAPVITWNDLSQALFPNAAEPVAAAAADADPTPARGAFGPDGVFKQGWAGVFFSAGLAPAGAPGPGAGADDAGVPGAPAGPGPVAAAPAGTGPGAEPVPGAPVPAPQAPATCGRFTPQVCEAYTEAAVTGRLSPATADLLRASSPATVTDRITAPTLLVQGEQDTLFGLDQSDANAREIAAAGGAVRTVWFEGGHDGAPADDAVRDEIGGWFDFHLAGVGEDPGTGFGYAVESGIRTQGNTPTSRTVEAPAYPGLPGSPALEVDRLPLEGGPQVAVNPAGGNPAAITTLPGLGGALGGLGGRISALASELPGQSAQFTTPAAEDPLLVTGAPQVDIAVSRVPGQPAPAEAVLFGKVYEVSPDGFRSLLGSAVAPVRVPVPEDGSPALVSVTLPGVVAPIEAGNRLVVSFGTTDQGFAGPVEPAVWSIALPDDPDGGGTVLTIPVVPGEAVAANTVPLGPAVGIAVVLGLALVGWLVARVLGRRRRPAPGADDPRRPLEIRDLAKTYRGGFSAVQGVSFAVERGMVLGLLGPNGAGKTTVLRMLMGLIEPTAGTIRAFGEPVGPGAPVLARIGAFVEGPGFLPHLSGGEPAPVLGGHRAPDGGGARRGGAGDRRARRVGAAPRRYLQPGHAPAARDRPGDARAAGAAGARRADQRARPAPDPRHARGAAPVRGRRPHGAGLQPPARRGGADLHPRGGDAPRQGGRRRTGRGDHRGRRGGELHRRRPRPRSRDPGRPRRGARGRGRRRGGARRAQRHPARLGGPRPGERRHRRSVRRTATAPGGRVPAARRRGQGAMSEPSVLVPATGYRPNRTLPLRVELVRQLRRRRTQVAFALVALLPVILWGAFELADDGPPTGSLNLVDLAKGSAVNFAVFAMFAAAGFLLVVVVALFFGDTVAAEASWSSLRYLLAAPIPRARLLRQKAIVAALLSVSALLLLPMTALAVGSLAYGTGDFVSPTGESLPFATAAGRVLLGGLYIAVHLSWVAALALLLSVSTDAPLGAVGGAVMASIVSQILDQITALEGLRNYLPTHYGNAWAALLGQQVDWGDMTRGAFSAVTYATVFGALAVWRFRWGHLDLTPPSPAPARPARARRGSRARRRPSPCRRPGGSRTARRRAAPGRGCARRRAGRRRWRAGRLRAAGPCRRARWCPSSSFLLRRRAAPPRPAPAGP